MLIKVNFHCRLNINKIVMYHKNAWNFLAYKALNLAVKKTRIGFRIGLGIGSDFESDQTPERIGSDWYFRFWCRIIIFG